MHVRISQGLCSKYGLLQQSICYTKSRCINFIIWVLLERRAEFLPSDLLIHLARKSCTEQKAYNVLYDHNFSPSIDTIFFLSELLKCVFRMLKTLLVAAGWYLVLSDDKLGWQFIFLFLFPFLPFPTVWTAGPLIFHYFTVERMARGKARPNGFLIKV